MGEPSKPLAYYATLQHAQWMLTTDGHYLRAIQRGSVDAAVRMFRDYNVARTIWGNGGLARLARSVMESSEPWPKSLAERAQWCRRRAEEDDRALSQNRGRKQGAPYSAVTKLCWFLRPHGWTMYDRFARLGLSGPADIEAFYHELEQHDFSIKAAELNDIAAQFGLGNLFGERIIDKFLMLRGIYWKGSPEAASSILQSLDHFVDQLGEMHNAGREMANALVRLAERACEVLPDNSFWTHYAAYLNEKRAH